MRPRTRWALPLALLFVLAGCANVKAGTPAATDSAGCPTVLAVTADDNQKTLCVAVGGTVTVTLESPGATHWLLIESSGAALTRSPITPSTATRTSSAQFTAASVGQSIITSARPNCPTQSNQTGVSCHSIMAWKVTINVK